MKIVKSAGVAVWEVTQYRTKPFALPSEIAEICKRQLCVAQSVAIAKAIVTQEEEAMDKDKMDRLEIASRTYEFNYVEFWAEDDVSAKMVQQAEVTRKPWIDRVDSEVSPEGEG